jgi:hypothetical protein
MTLRHIEKCIMAVACAATLAAPGPGLARTAKPPSPVAAPAPASAPAPAPTSSLRLPLAREVVQRTIQLVETKALLPRVPDEYAQAKSRVLALLDQDGGEIDRRELYARLNALLRTLDVDGHSFISSPQREVQRQRNDFVATPRPPQFALVAATGGAVLRWTPPQIVSTTPESFAAYLARLHEDAAGLASIGTACALIVDLSEQRGGNAWPPFVVMYPLFGAANTASMVDRNGARTPFVNPAQLKQMETGYAGDRPNPLARFAGLPLAVVVERHTSSAGEMLLVALLGEGERVQTFGRSSSGMSTANSTYPLPDGAMLVLTEKRYAIGDKPVFRGPIPAGRPAAPGEPIKDVVRQAAQWAADKSPLCAARPPVVAVN